MKRTIEHSATRRTRPELRREMGLWTATAMVVGNMIGSGVFLLPAALAGIAIAALPTQAAIQYPHAVWNPTKSPNARRA